VSINKYENDLFVESLYKLQQKIVTVVMTVKLERETHVPDLMTRIRILPSVAVVGQKDRVDRYADGDARLQISIKFLPRSEQIYKNLKYLSGMIKKLPGVLSVSIDVYNKRLITSKGSKIVF
tara:strand:- start:587 stop:952 length:366 start_codon:yes stop_codon:yes gene_type:complete